jgi:hypothetical protein
MGNLRVPDRLVLAPFGGDHGRRLERALFDRLALNDALSVVYRAGRQAVPGESLSEPEGMRAWQPVADALLRARTTATLSDVPGSDRVEVREGTGQFRQFRDVDGNWVSVEIMRTRLQRVHFIVRQVTLTVQFRVEHLKGGEVTSEWTESVSSAEKYGGESLLPVVALPSVAVTWQTLAERLAARMALHLAGPPARP